jgi:hypothetical protein
MNSQPHQFNAVKIANCQPVTPRELARLCISANSAVNAARTHHKTTTIVPKMWNNQDTPKP